jgi:hypothetical protein
MCAKKGFKTFLLCFTMQVCWVTNKFIILQKVSLGGGILPWLGSHDEGLVFDGVIKWQRARNQLNKSG